MTKWKPVVGYEEYYEISNTGLCRSLDRLVPNKGGRGRIKSVAMKIKGRNISILLGKDPKSYFSVMMSKNGITKRKYVHRLMSLAFIPNPRNKPCVNHIDGNKLNNNIDNLEWCTYSENAKHAVKMGLHFTQKGEECHLSKLTEIKVSEIRWLLQFVCFSGVEIGDMYGVDNRTISAINTGLTWKGVK